MIEEEQWVTLGFGVVQTPWAQRQVSHNLTHPISAAVAAPVHSPGIVIVFGLVFDQRYKGSRDNRKGRGRK